MTLNNHNLVHRMLKARQANGNTGNGGDLPSAGSSATVSQSSSSSSTPVSSSSTANPQTPTSAISSSTTSAPSSSSSTASTSSISSSTTSTSSTSSSTSTGITTKPLTATGVTTGPGLAQTSSFANVSPASKGNTSVGAIVGGVLGAIALLLLLGIFYYRRRRRQGLAYEVRELKPFMVSEHQHPNFIQVPSSLAAQQSSFATAMSKNAAPRRAIQQLNYPPPAALGKREAVSQQTPSAVLAPHPQQSTSTTTVTNPASDPPASVPDLPSRVFIHQDSGIRLPEQGPDVVEYPPIYTPG